MSVLLVNVGPPASYPAVEALAAPNLGLGYLAAVLLEAGFDTHTADLFFDPISDDEILTAIPALETRLVGLSTITASYANTVALAQRIRTAFPDLPIVVGGTHVTFMDEEALVTGCFDVVARFEGELIMRDLARYYLEGHGELANIDGISFRDATGRVCRTPRRAAIEDLDGLPFPARHLAPLDHYAKVGIKNVGLLSSRGCAYRCTFCNNEAFTPHRRIRSIDSCVQEIDAIAPLGFDLYHFWDEDLFARTERARELMGHMAERGLNWTAVVAATDKVDRALIQEFKDSGGTSLFLGVESASDEILAAIRRPNRLKTILRVVEDIISVGGVTLEVGIIIGHPQDTPASVDKTIALASTMSKAGVAVHITINTPFPGTHQLDHAEELGLRIVEPDWDKYDLANAVMDTPHLTAFEINGYARAALVEVNRNSAHMLSTLRMLTSR